MKQIGCIFLAICLISWILITNVSSVGYGYDGDYETDYDSKSGYEKSEYPAQHENDYDYTEKEDEDKDS